jgi:hypothetical protein
VALLLTLLRFGPRLDDKARDMGHSDQRSVYSATGDLSTRDINSNLPDDDADSELHPLQRADPATNTSFRQRASLGGIL